MSNIPKLKQLAESILNKNVFKCPLCREPKVGTCKCASAFLPHTMEDLKQGHGMMCKNGHRFTSEGLSYDPSKEEKEGFVNFQKGLNENNFKIATIDSSGNEEFMLRQDGSPQTWNTRDEAEKQIEMLKHTAGYGAREPKNFKYIIVPSTEQLNENDMWDGNLIGTGTHTAGIVTPGTATFSSPDNCQNQEKFYAVGQNTVDMYNNAKATGPDPEDVKKLKNKVTPDEIITGVDAEMKKMFNKNKSRAKALVVKNLKQDPKYYSSLHSLGIDGGDDQINEDISEKRTENPERESYSIGEGVYDKNGEFLGTYINKLTDLFPGETIDDMKRLISSGRCGVLKYSKFAESPYYGIRLVYSPEFGSINQALINYLGSPAWINIEKRLIKRDINESYCSKCDSVRSTCTCPRPQDTDVGNGIGDRIVRKDTVSVAERNEHDPYKDNPQDRPKPRAAKSHDQLMQDPRHPLGRRYCPKCQSVNVISPSYPKDWFDCTDCGYSWEPTKKETDRMYNPAHMDESTASGIISGVRCQRCGKYHDESDTECKKCEVGAEDYFPIDEDINNLPKLTPEQIKQAKDWIKDCSWEDLESNEVDSLSYNEIVRGINHNYDGGLKQFISDCEPIKENKGNNMKRILLKDLIKEGCYECGMPNYEGKELCPDCATPESDRVKETNLDMTITHPGYAKKHIEHAKKQRLVRPCTSYDYNFGGGCFNCGFGSNTVNAEANKLTPDERSQDESEVSDRYKDENGFRPRFLASLSDIELTNMLKDLRDKARGASAKTVSQTKTEEHCGKCEESAPAENYCDCCDNTMDNCQCGKTGKETDKCTCQCKSKSLDENVNIATTKKLLDDMIAKKSNKVQVDQRVVNAYKESVELRDAKRNRFHDDKVNLTDKIKKDLLAEENKNNK